MKRKNILALAAVAAAGTIAGGTALYSKASDMTDAYFAEAVNAVKAGTDSESAGAAESAAVSRESAAEEGAAAKQGSAAPVSAVETVGEDSSSTPDFSYSNVADITEAAMPSIVAITNKSVQEVRSYFYGQSFQYESESAGSGIIMGSNDTELLICTNNHVVEGASELTVSFIDEQSAAAHIKGTDAGNDLAVVAVRLEDIPEDTMNAIKTAKIGDSDEMRVGEQVVAIGNALGYGQSVTTGIVSAKDRSITVGNEGSDYSHYQTESTSVYDGLIQTDAAINPGNSGGALLNMSGEVIGINSAKAGSNGVEGMGYAIPVSKAMPILDELMTRKTRSKVDEADMGYIGVSGQGVSSDATSLYGIPAGMYLTEVREGSPADQAGLKEGDIISKFDGENVSDMQELQYLLQYYEAGETVELTVQSMADQQKGYEEETLSITLGDRSQLQ